MKSFSKANRPQGWDSNRGLPEYDIAV